MSNAKHTQSQVDSADFWARQCAAEQLINRELLAACEKVLQNVYSPEYFIAEVRAAVNMAKGIK